MQASSQITGHPIVTTPTGYQFLATSATQAKELEESYKAPAAVKITPAPTTTLTPVAQESLDAGKSAHDKGDTLKMVDARNELATELSKINPALTKPETTLHAQSLIAGHPLVVTSTGYLSLAETEVQAKQIGSIVPPLASLTPPISIQNIKRLDTQAQQSLNLFSEKANISIKPAFDTIRRYIANPYSAEWQPLSADNLAALQDAANAVKSSIVGYRPIIAIS